MKIPLQSIWYIVEETSGKNNATYIDNERYEILMYMAQKDSFDFLPEEWPIMANYYGEVQK
jgi:hypothetical protein